MLAVERAAYLTIEDGPAEDFMQKINYLNANGIRAIWFCLGEALEKNLEAALYAIQSGHVIGNRGYGLADFSTISLMDARGQIERTDRLIDDLYARTDIARPIKVFRFPFMQDDMNQEHFAGIQLALEQLGYQQPAFENIHYAPQDEASLKQGLHVICTQDTFDLGLEASSSEGSRPFGSAGNEIILIHDWISVAPFKVLLDSLLKKGIGFLLPREMKQPAAAF
ncbi:polysaccharide deacetylase family protein [Paenibacillus sp. LPE1-1-1.1]|uniref:polysaccharide deacetylase family protein n=1 Tax=Paenibacillus sp. LPE1-1-1.1 TaxID=3135230 RepID=UPI00341723AD